MRKTTPAAVLLAFALVALAGCPRSEPRVVLYCAQDEEFAKDLLETFRQRSGLEVAPKFDTEADKSVSLYEELVREGPWGIFRLFDAGTVTAEKDKDEAFTVTWQLTAPPVSVNAPCGELPVPMLITPIAPAAAALTTAVLSAAPVTLLIAAILPVVEAGKSAGLAPLLLIQMTSPLSFRYSLNFLPE